jgi:DNA polymerase III subunit delta'
MGASNNWGIIGHEWAVDSLTNHILQNRVRHAYLLTGPQGVGRRTLALALAQALNCPQAQANAQPCGECLTCKRTKAMTYPDLVVVQAEQVGGVLKVDQIREIQHSLALAPYEGTYRLALLLRFEEAHTSASNALLKTLEEPNPQVILVLTAENAEKLLPTIVSRCEILRLRPVSFETLTTALETRFEIPPDEARLLAHISSGRPGKAIQLHLNPDQLEKRIDLLNDLTHLLSASRVERFAYAENLAKDKDNPKETTRILLQTWSSFWRDVLLKTTQSSMPITNLDLETEIDVLSRRMEIATCFRLIQQIEMTIGLIDQNVNLRLAMEVMLLNMPKMSKSILA